MQVASRDSELPHNDKAMPKFICETQKGDHELISSNNRSQRDS